MEQVRAHWSEGRVERVAVQAAEDPTRATGEVGNGADAQCQESG